MNWKNFTISWKKLSLRLHIYFNCCVKCKKERKGRKTLSYNELNIIGCSIKEPFAYLPVCNECYLEYIKYSLRGLM